MIGPNSNLNLFANYNSVKRRKCKGYVEFVLKVVIFKLYFLLIHKELLYANICQLIQILIFSGIINMENLRAF